jgi:hypothetical protein
MIQLNFTKQLQGEALRDEKQKDFRNVVVLQCCILFSALLLKPLLEIAGFHETHLFRDTLFLIFGGIYVLVLWDLLRNFTQSRWLVNGLFIIIMGSYLLALFTVNPFFQLFDEEQKRPYLFFIHMVLFIIELTVIYFVILDMFSGDKRSSQKLWGAACVYLMIAICFGSAYDLISIVQLGALGAPLNLGLESYTECIYFSLCVLGGQDTVYDSPIRLVKNLAVIEALWGNLFVVLLVGRLLATD